MDQRPIKEGGSWLGAVRSWMQWHKRNGDSVTWGSDEELNPPMTVREIEEVARKAVEADRAEREKYSQKN